MIPWGLLKNSKDNIETFVQFAIREGWSKEQIQSVLQDHFSPEKFDTIYKSMLQEFCYLFGAWS